PTSCCHTNVDKAYCHRVRRNVLCVHTAFCMLLDPLSHSRLSWHFRQILGAYDLCRGGSIFVVSVRKAYMCSRLVLTAPVRTSYMCVRLCLLRPAYVHEAHDL